MANSMPDYSVNIIIYNSKLYFDGDGYETGYYLYLRDEYGKIPEVL